MQGCGKSLCAKVVASAWHMPLLRMDPGVLYQKFIGESEARLREALAAGRVDGPGRALDRRDREGLRLGHHRLGRRRPVAADVRHAARPGCRTIATPIFLIATANNIAQLPPELMRKGRFDEIFFVDLPGPEEREAIFAIHLRKRSRDKASFDMATVGGRLRRLQRRGDRAGGRLRPLRGVRRQRRSARRNTSLRP